jgi:glycosyltransferase involved in cell wall biosynthesis
MLQKRKYDLLWIEYEAFPWVPYWMESMLLSSSVPFVLDYDDAIFHRYDMHGSALVRAALGNKIDLLMRRSTMVIAGNEYLAGRARESGARRVEIVPTVIDLDKYPEAAPQPSAEFTVGWIGTPKTVHYLNGIREALQIVGKEGGMKVVTVGSDGFALAGVPCEHRPWNESTEVAEMQKFDAGVMPLVDGPWERGKCGHKLIQYMGCSRPVVASPVGVNKKIVEQGETGFLASSTEEWVTALRTLKENRSLRLEMGKNGRTKVEREYSLQVAAPRLASILAQCVKGSG